MNGATRDPTWQLNRVAGTVLLVTLAFFAAVTMQRWVGGETIYAKELEARRLQVHIAILNNRPPSAQTWESLGRNTIMSESAQSGWQKVCIEPLGCPLQRHIL